MFHTADFSATRLQLDPGDSLFLYTDGLSEAHNENTEYGVDRVTLLVRQQATRPPADLIAACLDDLRAFCGSSERTDDLTLLAIRRSA
jgi:sigma-B regulation protein RsbU (phosphoserine phosphatase)